MPTLLSAINGGVRLADGSVVVSDRANFRIQRFDPKGEHLWSRGREGEGPGEFEYVRLALGCATAERIVVYDIWTDRVSVFSKEGELLDEYRFLYNGLPIREFSCAPNGRLGFAGSSVRMGETGAEPGDIIRELLSLGSAELGDTAATMLRERIPSSEVRYLAPGESMPGSTWSHDAVFAASNLGVWFGTSEDYEVELVASSCWTSALTGRLYERGMTWMSSGSRYIRSWRISNGPSDGDADLEEDRRDQHLLTSEVGPGGP